MKEYLDILLDAFIDSLGVFGFAVVLYIVFSFVEDKVAILLKKHKKMSPALGAVSGLIPQCGVSVVASDLYLKSHISMGCLVAVFFACSDEALPILLFPKDGNYKNILYVIPLLLIKLIGGFLVGFLTDLIIRKKEEHHEEHEHDEDHDHDEEEDEDHVGCCHHTIEHDESKIHQHLIHPLLHSLKIFGYVMAVNLFFGLLIYWLGGEEKIKSFFEINEWLTPIYSVLLSGLVPNCAASVLTTELFQLGGLPFGALVSGLCVNAGLGLVFLLKNKKSWKDVLIIMGILWGSGLIFGYATMGIMLLF